MSTIGDFAPIERSSVAEKVAKHLLDLVRSKSLKPGDTLPPERELAAMMQVSRPSVREALRGLQILGVLKARQGGGIHVSSLDAADLLAPLQLLITLNVENVDALYESRLIVDTHIGRLAAERMADADIERMRGLLVVQKDLIGDPLAFRVSDSEFHRIIWEATRNPFLQQISASLYVLGMEYRRIAAETPGVTRQSYADHQLIVEAIAARDIEAAGRAMEIHMANVHHSTLAAMAGARD